MPDKLPVVSGNETIKVLVKLGFKESELLKPIINKIKSEQVAKSIREDRER